MYHDDCAVQTLALELVGSFARVQEAIERVAALYFDKNTPELAKYVKRRALKNMRDDDRIEVFKALVNELKVEISTPTFTSTFNSVKAHRDTIAHSARFTSEGEDTLIVSTTEWLNVDGSHETVRLSRSELSKGIKRCDWMRHSAMYLLSRSGLIEKMMYNGQAVTITRPSPSPDDWTDEMFAAI